MQENTPHEGSWPHKRELMVLGGFAALTAGLAAARGLVHHERTPQEAEELARAQRCRQVAAVLLDKTQGKALKEINRMAALMAVLERGTRPEINAHFGENGSRAAKAMVPLLQQGMISVDTSGDGRQADYVMDMEVAGFVEGNPKEYREFHTYLPVWQDRLESPG